MLLCVSAKHTGDRTAQRADSQAACCGARSVDPVLTDYFSSLTAVSSATCIISRKEV
jgi:hypothetical protein